MLYRVKQFIWSFLDKFKPIDETFLEQYLTQKEKDLFYKLNKTEQHHSIRVCNNALNKEYDENIDKNKLAKIALLHDIGKGKCPLNVVDKSLLVIFDKVTKGNLKKYDNEKVKLYYYHPKYSAELLRGIDNYDNDFLEAIEEHHNKSDIDNKYWKIIKVCDDIS